MARLRKKLSGDGGPLSSAAAAGETWSVRSGWMDEWMDEPCAGKLVVDIHYMYVHRANHAEREGEDGPHSVQPTEVPMNDHTPKSHVSAGNVEPSLPRCCMIVEMGIGCGLACLVIFRGASWNGDARGSTPSRPIANANARLLSCLDGSTGLYC